MAAARGRTTRQVALTENRPAPAAAGARGAAQLARLRSAAAAPAQPAPFELVVGTRYELGHLVAVPSAGAAGPQATRADAAPLQRRQARSAAPPRARRAGRRGRQHAADVAAPRLRGAAPRGVPVVGTETRCCAPREDARALTLVDVSPDFRCSATSWTRSPDAEPWPFARSEYMGGIGNIRQRVLDGAGRVAVLPRYFIADDVAAGRLVWLMPRDAPARRQLPAGLARRPPARGRAGRPGRRAARAAAALSPLVARRRGSR